MKMKAFVTQLARNVIEGETMAVAGELTYKLMLSSFPLMTFMLSLLGFLNLDIYLLDGLTAPYLPEDIHALLMGFVHNLTLERNATLLSLSFLLTLAASSSGFRAMMRGISKSYGIRDNRHYIVRVALSVALTLVFSATVVVAVVAVVFRDALLAFFLRYDLRGDFVIGALSYVAAFSLMLAAVMLIYKISSRKRFTSVLPGSVFTVCLWLISSQFFNFYVTRFPIFSLYGGIASAFVLLIWLNMVSIIMLLGAQLNAILEKQPPQL